MNQPTLQRNARAKGFTLLEVMIATLVFAILMASLNSVLFSTLHLREKTMSLLEDNIPLNQSMAIMKRDLRGILPPGGIMAGDLLGVSTGAGNSTINHLDFYTTSGIVDDTQVWGEVQKISYYLRSPDATEKKQGFQLVRAITRNMLPYNVVDPVEEALIGGVRALDFSFYSGTDWRASWDSTVMTNLPAAIRMTITMEPASNERIDPPCLELVFPIIIQARTNQTNVYKATGTSASLKNKANRGAA